MKSKLILACISVSFLFATCKSVEEAGSTSISRKVTPKVLEKKLNANLSAYDWFEARAKMNYTDKKGAQSFTANIRYKKDSVIWMSLTGFLGIEGGRVLITNDSVYIIDRLNKKYYEYPLSYIQKYIPFPLEIMDLQHMLNGDKFYSYRSKPSVKLDNDLYQLTSNDSKVESHFWLHPKNYTLAQMRLKDKLDDRQLLFKFDDYKKLENRLFAFERILQITNGKELVNVEMNFTKIKVNEPQTFPFEVSDRYTRIN